MRLFTVSQIDNYNHEHRWIFNKKELKEKLNIKEKEIKENLFSFDDYFILNGSPCVIKEAKNIDEIISFLKEDNKGPDLEDPTIVDIAEYYLTIDTDTGQAARLLNNLKLDPNLLTQYDKRLNMIWTHCNPYDKHIKSMRFSEFEDKFIK